MRAPRFESGMIKEEARQPSFTPDRAHHIFQNGSPAVGTMSRLILSALLVPLVHGFSAPLFAVGRRAAAPSLCAVGATLQQEKSFAVINSYSGAIDLLLDEIADTQQGDEISLCLYLLEGGESSERVLVALEEAGKSRGVSVRFRLDVSYVSAISRLIEKTDTLIPRAEAMAAANSQWCSCTYRSKPDHSKFATFARAGDARASSAILGGINLGDRFADWDDYAVRLPGAYADDVVSSLLCDDDECDATFAFSTKDTATSVAAATTIAYVSPVVALFTLLTTASLVATISSGPLAAATEHQGWLTSGAVLTAVLAAAAAALGTAFATAADGTKFELPYELGAFVRSLVWDRSALGDALAPLRSIYTDRRGIRGAAEGAAGEVVAPSAVERRLLPLATLPTAEESVRIVCNRRVQMRYEIEPTFRALFADTSLSRYRVAMAYLGHRWGLELLEYALQRNATVELLIPARPNVYANENLKAAQTLIDAEWPTLELYLHPEMVHAKATLAFSHADADSPAGMLAFVGSANLVRGSLNLPVHCGLLPYDELNVLTTEGAICESLDASMDSLFSAARKVERGEQLLEASEWYSGRRAMWEELWQ